jgi:replicative DNA helicase
MDKMVQQTSVVSKEFKMMAVNLNILILLIAQPRKKSKNKDGSANDSPLTSDDIRDSKMISHDADYVVILHRKRKPVVTNEEEDIFEPETVFILDRARYGKTGKRYLHYHSDWTLFTELDRQLI